MSTENVLEIRGLKSSFFTDKGEVPAVNGVDLVIPRGKIVGLVGESGCGKSMTAKSVMGLLKYPGRIVEGEILLGGKDLTKLSDRELREHCGKDISKSSLAIIEDEAIPNKTLQYVASPLDGFPICLTLVL